MSLAGGRRSTSATASARRWPGLGLAVYRPGSRADLVTNSTRYERHHMTTSLVTGGAGFLGSHLCDQLMARGHRVICVDNLETGSLVNITHIHSPDFRHLNADIIAPYEVDEPVDFVYPLP